MNKEEYDKFAKETTFQPPLLAAEAVTNIPFHEFYELVEDGTLLSQQELENWQRLAIILGYKPWQLGIDNNDKDDDKNQSSTIQTEDIQTETIQTETIKIN